MIGRPDMVWLRFVVLKFIYSVIPEIMLLCWWVLYLTFLSFNRETLCPTLVRWNYIWTLLNKVALTTCFASMVINVGYSAVAKWNDFENRTDWYPWSRNCFDSKFWTDSMRCTFTAIIILFKFIGESIRF